MQKFKESLDRLLSALPFNNNKTTVGLAINALLPFVATTFPAVLSLEPVIAAAATVLTGIGLLHKAIKETKK